MSNHLQVVVSGYYGFGNAGDDAILLAILGQLGESMPGSRVTVATYPFGDAEAVTALAGVPAIDGRDLEAVVDALRSADVLVIGGGGLVQDYLPSDPVDVLTTGHGNLSFWTSLVLLARIAGVPVATWSLGVGPLSTDAGRDQARRLFEQIGLVCVRDLGSAAFASDLGVHDDRLVVAADPVFGLGISGLGRDEGSEGRLRIGVSVRPWDDAERWEDELAQALDRIVEEYDADIVFVPLEQTGRGTDDGVVSATVAARMKNVDRRSVVTSRLPPLERLGLLAGSDLVIGMRMHSIVAAAAGAVPFVALAYDPKVAATADALTLGDQVLYLESFSADDLAGAAGRALRLDPDRQAAYRQAAESLRLSAREAGPRLAGFLSRPSMTPETAETTAAIGEIAVARALDLARRERDLAQATSDLEGTAAERDRALADERRTQERLEDVTAAYDKLAAEYQAFLDARAIRAVRSMWSLREKVRDLPGRTVEAARAVLPAGARRRIRSAVGRSWAPAPPVLDPAELAAARERIDADLDRIVADHPDAPGFVISPPGIGWDVELFQRPQQMALAFARLGYPVLYHLEHRYRNGLVGFEERRDGIYVGYVPDELTDLLHRIPRPIYLSYVYNFDWRRHLEHPITVYEHIDDLEVFEHVYDRRELDRWHAHALAEAEVVAASAVDLLDGIAPERPDAVLVPNGVDFAHFAGTGSSPTPDDLADLVGRTPVVGYYGALAEWFDYDLLESAAEALPDMGFVLIGPDYDGTAGRARALNLPNVRWLGPRPYADLPAYLACFDVATIPFVVNDVTHAVSPLKLFEYMAGGKPVVTPPLRECSRYEAVQIGEGADGFVDAIRRALELKSDPDYVALLERTARENTWDARARTILEAVSRAPA